MSFQTQERYWTDYVRIATPIVGLLVLLGVFWFWASSLIGDNSDVPPPTQPAAVVTTIAANTPTPTATEDVVLSANTPEPTQAVATEDTGQANPPQTEPTQPPAEQPTDTPSSASSGTFTQGQSVVTTEEVRMRSDTTTAVDNVVDDLQGGVSLTILSGQPVVNEGYTWWNVQEVDNGKTGWVVEDYLSAA